MNEFQIQNQWENDSLRVDEPMSEKDTEKKGVSVKKGTIVLFGGAVILIIVAVLCLYLFGRPIEGVWVRQEDDTHVAGMVVKVEKVNGTLQGTIIDMNEGIGKFDIGSVKWIEIRKTGFGRYELHDFDERVKQYGELPSICTVLRGGKKLILTHSTTQTGGYQVWDKR